MLKANTKKNAFKTIYIKSASQFEVRRRYWEGGIYERMILGVALKQFNANIYIYARNIA